MDFLGGFGEAFVWGGVVGLTGVAAHLVGEVADGGSLRVGGDAGAIDVDCFCLVNLATADVVLEVGATIIRLVRRLILSHRIGLNGDRFACQKLGNF